MMNLIVAGSFITNLGILGYFKSAVYVSFFPQLVAGPIERSKNLLKQLTLDNHFDCESALDGFILMLWGYFLKIVLADRIAIFIYLCSCLLEKLAYITNFMVQRLSVYSTGW